MDYGTFMHEEMLVLTKTLIASLSLLFSYALVWRAIFLCMDFGTIFGRCLAR